MKKTNDEQREVLKAMEDNIIALENEFNGKEFSPRYLDEKLGNLEWGCKYLRGLIDED